MRVPEAVEDFGFLVLGAAVGLILVRLVIVGVHHDGGTFFTQQLVQLCLILDAARTVIHYDLRLIPVWTDFLCKVLGNMSTDLVDTGIIVHDRLHIDPTRELAAFRVGKTLGQDVKFPVHGILVHPQIHRDRLKVQRQCGAVTDGVREGILAHIAAAVFCGTKGGKVFLSMRLMGVPVKPKKNAFGRAARILMPRSPS